MNQAKKKANLLKIQEIGKGERGVSNPQPPDPQSGALTC